MELDEELCLCFHVSKRKVVNFIRVERPQKVGQLADCFGAGTGCGWCRSYLKMLFDCANDESDRSSTPDGRPGVTSSLESVKLPSAADYAAMRTHYRHQQKSPGLGQQD